ncbi:MAG: hypothetical protein WCO63_01015 [Bacteroidota bacterium]
MVKFIRGIGISILALILLAGSAGISLFVHACGNGKHIDYAFYPEYFSVGKSCCNPWAGKTMSGCDKHQHQVIAGLSKACCESNHLLLKVPNLFNHQNRDISLFQVSNIATQTSNLKFGQNTSGLCLDSFSGHDPSPPPLFGRDLIISLNQIRIPS